VQNASKTTLPESLSGLIVGGGVKVLLARRFENTVTQAAKRF
jgi:hypothetical protein